MMEVDEKEIEEQIESYLNGNVSMFAAWIKSHSGYMVMMVAQSMQYTFGIKNPIHILLRLLRP